MSVLPLRTVPILLCALLLTASFAAAAPANHGKCMADASYKEAFEGYSATLQEAKTRLDAKAFAAVQKAVEAEMAQSAREDMQSGMPEAEAWSVAYALGQGSLNRELEWNWLRRHSEGIQGFYRMRSTTFDGWLTVQRGDAPDLYAVKISAVQKAAPFNSGELDGFGRLKGAVMQAVDKNDDQNPIQITFKGDTANIAEPKAFKQSGALGAGVSFDGSYLREKK